MILLHIFLTTSGFSKMPWSPLLMIPVTSKVNNDDNYKQILTDYLQIS